MKTSNKNEKKELKFKTKMQIPLIITVITIFWSLLCATNLLDKFDFRLYDLLVLLKKAPAEQKELLFVDIDDFALNELGEWPWSRDKIADCLLTMREVGAKTAVFDIEYLSPSSKSIDYNLIEKIKQNPDAADQISQIFIDNDDYFARAVQFFGNTWLTINAGDLAIKYTDENLEYAKKRFLYQIEDKKDFLKKCNANLSYKEFSPAMHSIISRAKGAGFTNVSIDSDGTRRRIRLLFSYKDGALGQLSFAPLLKILNPEKIEFQNRKLILKNCTMPDSSVKTIKIPLDSTGHMYINWIKKTFNATKKVQNEDGTFRDEVDNDNSSFQHNSIFYLWYLPQLEKNVINGLLAFDNLKALNLKNENGAEPAYVSEVNTLLSDYNDILEYKSYILSCMNGYDADGNPIGGGIDDATFDEYFALRENFFANAGRLLNSDSIQELLRFDSVASDENFLTDLTYFSQDLEDYLTYYYDMKKIYADKFCIIGNTGSGTTDLGSTPFQKSYPNVGTHANVYNTIMNQDFITPLEWYWGSILAFALSITLLAFHVERRTAVQILCGITLITAVIALPIILMVCFSIYLPALTPIMIGVSSYLSVTVLRFLSSEKNRKFIQGAFSQCLSKDVVQEIINNPNYFVLGGKNFEMTALFTDIQKFSSFSELLTAAELVSLLNYYLTKMSDIIINERGTVDKYEGDAIVAFVGAPIPMEDHAIRACSAAIKMKQAEKVINEEIKVIAAGEKPEGMEDTLFSAFQIMIKNNKTIFTRIGLNSGTIVAGFMGSENKKNYTVMGNNVNLSSRLEGVNKQYSTDGILISEATKNLLDDSFVVRSLDRVQVVNVKTPIRLYELVTFKADAGEKLLNYMAAWEQTMRIFESGNYSQALLQFNKLLQVRPNDNVCKYYINLISTFFINGKYPTAQDNFGVAYNAENPADMDPSWIGTPKEIKGTFTLLQK